MNKFYYTINFSYLRSSIPPYSFYTVSSVKQTLVLMWNLFAMRAETLSTSLSLP